MTWLVPELTLLTAREVTDPEEAWRLSRAVIVPQPPVNSRVVALDHDHDRTGEARGVARGEDGAGEVSGAGGGGDGTRWNAPAIQTERLGARRRPFRFSLVGGIINAERRRLVDALRDRPDTFARMQCREGRFESISMVGQRMIRRVRAPVNPSLAHLNDNRFIYLVDVLMMIDALPFQLLCVVRLFADAQYSQDLERIYASSDFCIVPFGDAFSSRRSFDAMRMGCVPVLTNPLMQLPFPDRIDYAAFVVFLDAKRGGAVSRLLCFIHLHRRLPPVDFFLNSPLSPPLPPQS